MGKHYYESLNYIFVVCLTVLMTLGAR